jgi:transposase
MHPEWVTKHKQKGTNIACISGRYYLYAVTSTWNKDKKRAQKITKQYLGRITKQGLTPPKTKPTPTPQTPPTIKEYGATHTLNKLGQDILTQLQKNFTKTQAQQIFTIATLRVIQPNPFKRTEKHYQTSYLSELYPNLNLTKNHLTNFLQTLGTNRDAILEFMKHFTGSSQQHILFDGTNLHTNSKKLPHSRKGYNAAEDFEPQINLLYAFAAKSKMPAYYRILPGNIREVTAFKLSIAEADFSDVVVIGDKGFGSKANFDMLTRAGLCYIVPLKRDNALFNTSKLKTGDKALFDGYFLFNERPIWYYKLGEKKKKVVVGEVEDGGCVVVFLDESLRCEEEKRYLKNLERELEGYSMEGFLEAQFNFGTIVLRSNVLVTSRELYELYKVRGEIEQMFDFLKNFLEQDKSYMQNEYSLEAWAFINHVSLMLLYRVYDLLRTKELLGRFSVADFLAHLKCIFKVKINDVWHLSEVTQKTHDLLNTINLPIT